MASIPSSAIPHPDAQKSAEACEHAGVVGESGSVTYADERATIVNSHTEQRRDHTRKPNEYLTVRVNSGAENGNTSDSTELLIEQIQAAHAGKDFTPLIHAAAADGYLSDVEVLLARGADVNVRDEGGWKPLHLAAHNGHLPVVNVLLALGADVNVRMKNDWTPLHLAAGSGHLLVVEALLARDAGVNVLDEFGGTPLHWAGANGHLPVVEALLARDADVNVVDEFGRTPLHWAGANGHLSVVEALLARGVEMNVVDEHGRTPLHWAATNGHPPVVESLLARGADMKVRDEDGWTPLHWAAANGHLPVVEALLAREADVNVRDEDGCTPLHWAAANGHLPVVEALLARGADVNVRKHDGRTPLHVAAQNGDLPVLEALVKRGGDLFAKDESGTIPLLLIHFHSSHGKRDLLKLFIKSVVECIIAIEYAALPGDTHVRARLLSDCVSDLKKQTIYSIDAHSPRPQWFWSSPPSPRTQMQEYLKNQSPIPVLLAVQNLLEADISVQTLRRLMHSVGLQLASPIPAPHQTTLIIRPTIRSNPYESDGACDAMITLVNVCEPKAIVLTKRRKAHEGRMVVAACPMGDLVRILRCAGVEASTRLILVDGDDVCEALQQPPRSVSMRDNEAAPLSVPIIDSAEVTTASPKLIAFACTHSALIHAATTDSASIAAAAQHRQHRKAHTLRML